MGRGRCRINVSVDGRFVAAGSSDGAVFIWDDHPRFARGAGAGAGAGTGAGTLPTILRGAHKEAVVATVFNSDVSALVTADKAGVVALWSLTGGGG